MKIRDSIVREKQYFDDFVEKQDQRINNLLASIELGEIAKDKLPKARNLIFVVSLERLIGYYSKGEDCNLLRAKYLATLGYMESGWDDSIVKLKMGRSQVIQNKYMLNEYCYVIWMLSLAILLKVGDKEINTLEGIIKNGNIDDEFIILLISFLTKNSFKNSSKSTYKPFSELMKQKESIDHIMINKYLQRWYSNTKLLTWHNYKSSIKTTKYYYGFWSFEAAAMTCVMDLNDNKYQDHENYPKDLVDFYRSK